MSLQSNEAPFGYTNTGVPRKTRDLRKMTPEEKKAYSRQQRIDWEKKNPEKVYAAKRKYLDSHRKEHNGRCVRWTKTYGGKTVLN